MTTTLKLHPGCAGTVVPGWANIDESPSVNLARFPRLRRIVHRAGAIGELRPRAFRLASSTPM